MRFSHPSGRKRLTSLLIGHTTNAISNGKMIEAAIGPMKCMSIQQG